jgi:hypothetical protein
LFWLVGKNKNDIHYLLDCFSLFGILFFIVGMIIALMATSRRHYYRHLKDKWKGKVESDRAFENGAKKRKNQMWSGIFVALTGIIVFTASGFIGYKIGYF